MTAGTPKTYTANRIAAALGVKRQTVQSWLEGVPPDCTGQADGQEARFWSVARLPESVRKRLAEAARQGGYRDADHLLSDPPRTWQPASPYAQCTDHYQQRARLLREALAIPLERRNDPSLSRVEFMAIALAEYKRLFRHSITERHWWNLFYRTLERAGASPDVTRLDLYLDERPARRPDAQPTDAPTVPGEFLELEAAMDAFRDRGKPTDQEWAFFWERVFEFFEERVASNNAPNKVKSSLMRYLITNAPFLAVNAEALRVAFRRKYERWVGHGREINALRDGRRDKSSVQGVSELPKNDRCLLIAAAAKLGGGRQQAWRMLHSRLGDAIRQRHPDTRRIPGWIDRLIGPDVKMEKTSLRGANAAKTEGAYVNRDPSGIASGDWDQSDDMTMVNVWWEESPDAPEGFWLGQGQFLMWIDERSWFAYGWNLISDPYYDAFSIRNSWTVKAAAWGLPRQGLSLERGIWKTSKLLVGEQHRDRDGSKVSIAESAEGLRRMGLRMHNATHARVKVIEGIYATQQDYFQAAPGYVGRNPITDRQERVQEQIRLVKSGKAHPSEFFLHKLQWREIIDKVLLDYNQTPKHGKYHLGRSPKQVFEDCFSSPLVKVPENLRHLLASNRYVLRVGGNGISFRFGKQPFRYKGYELGKRRGQKIVAWFNCENPDTICCTDEQGENPFVAERETKVFNHDPLPGTLENALRQNAAQNRYQKELHRSLKPYYNSDFFNNLFRPCLVNAEAVETAQEFANQGREMEARRNQKRHFDGRAQRVYSRLGALPPAGARPEQIEAMEQLNRLLKKEDEP